MNSLVNTVQNQSVVRVNDFQSRFHASLPFALFEGLKSGGELVLIYQNEPKDLLKNLESNQPDGISWQTDSASDGEWKVIVKKSDEEEVGCCGMCGG